ncbi:hypothetical protein Mal15_57040 [Stieleria maiorica]|uniref:Uncharacterized protein n=1 Tax=Stieleria maiorica TaxID=2795974 RepID=A0A5B9MPL7_9BACT|nr:hypothetical protein [Stieleria maiorica]QEG01626.1 hypothetical protein Mal15_57040 [Stieleria maiorica]
MKFIILAVLLAMFIAFVVMVVKAANQWRWYHITSAVIAMLLAVILLFPTAGVLKSRQAWHKIKEDLEKRLESVEEENERIQYGDSDGSTDGEGLKSLALKLSNLGTEAGRRWRSLSFGGADPSGQIILRANTAPAVPGQPAAPADDATGPLIPLGLVVYGFAEGKFRDLEQPVPMVYLGEFKVIASQPNVVTIAPTFPLERNQIDAINSGRATSWSLYEMLPLDGHEPFIAEGSKPDDDNILGRVDDELVKMILRANREESNKETIANYLRDGQRGSPEDPAARWIKIRFDQKYTIDVDSPEQRGALEGGFFDNNGRAVDSSLQRADGGSISFAVGDELIVKEEAAKLLIDQEKVASLVDTYYLRPLNDYRYVLRRIRLQISELDIRIAEMEYEKQVLDAAVAATVSMLEKGQTEKLKLEQDLAQHQVENKAVRQYFDQVRESLRQTKEATSVLYRDNFAKLRQIQQLAAAAMLTET